VGCLPEVVDEEGGILYDPDEREGLSQAMEAALEADLPQMGRHNYQKAKGLGWEEIARRTFEVYRAA
jgi:glycosyltransferase involved in cell wall biosynthesis